MEKASGTRAGFHLLFRLTQTGCGTFRWTEANVSCSYFSTTATCEHVDSASSSTQLQLMGREGESGGGGGTWQVQPRYPQTDGA
jgi:hypothetical protein